MGDQIDEQAVTMLNSLANRIVGLNRSELAAAGYSIDVSPASIVHSVGMKITTLGTQQVVATLDSPFGPIMIRIVLREPPVDEELAA